MIKAAQWILDHSVINMIATGLASLLCQLLVHTSTLFNDVTQVTVEFNTPGTVPPTSILLCINDTTVAFDNTTFRVVQLIEGGDLFSNTGQQVVVNNSLGANWTQAPFFLPSSAAQVQLQPVEYTSTRDVLATDPYYAANYLHQRYDNLYQDSQGVRITGLLNYTSPTLSTASVGSSSGNCVLLTGAWQPGIRYELTIQYQNPPGTSRKPIPLPWVAPITATTTSVQLPNGQVFQDAVLEVRGTKLGTACAIRQQAASIFTNLWDACTEVSLLGVTPGADTTACLAQLTAMGQPPTTFPFNQPPLVNYTTTSFAQTSCTGTNQVLSPRFGGQCVDCGPGGTVASGGSSCSCPAGVAPALLGPHVCGKQLRANTPAQVQTLARTLCASYTGMQQRWQTHQLSAKTVARVVLKAFKSTAESFLDEAAIHAANTTFYAQYIRDERHPESPTRAFGIKPSCNKCNGSMFKDVNSGKQVLLFDYQFDAMNTFRFIGYLLDTVAGVPCPQLWDRLNPLEWKYGYHSNKMCQPLPKA